MRIVRPIAVSIAITGFTATAALASTPPSGTASQVANAVANSPKIVKATPKVIAAIPNSATDTMAKMYPGTGNPGCDTAVQCVFGSTSSKKSVVLFGDSHAAQWLPAMVPIALENKFKLILIWHAGCHVADVDVRYEPVGPVEGFDFCNSWLQTQIATIKALKPNLVLLGERTALIGDINASPFTSAVWRAGLASTITALKTPSTRVAIFEDIPFGNVWPGQCLALNLQNVQSCSHPYPNNAFLGQQLAEQDAARGTKTVFISTHQWFCTTKTCSPVVGDYITKWDQGHASASYARYLKTVINTAVKPLL
jgi:hypothetical protein